MKDKLLKYPIHILFFLCFVEIMMLSYCRSKLGYFISPGVIFLISISIGILPLILFYNKKIQNNIILFPIKDKQTLYAISLFLVSVMVFMFIPRGGIVNIFRCFPIDAHYSDVVPSIQVMCRRLLHHEPIYVIIEDFGYHLHTTYLPFMWLPYTIAEKFHFDYRWITVLIFITGILLVLFVTIKTTNNGFFLTLVYTFLLLAIVDKNSDVFGWTVEVTNATYYSVLALSFFLKNKYIKAIILMICLLSRYSLVVFVPLYFIIEWKENGFKKTALFAVLTFVFMSLFLLPLVKNNWKELYNGYKYYADSGLNEWLHLSDKGLPYHISTGNGFVSWIYFLKTGSIEERFAFAKSLHLYLVISITLILSLIYFITRNKIDYRLFLLCGLKIYLAVFYGFIQVPYSYLFMVPLFYSIVLMLLVNNIYNTPKKSKPSIL
ncbi:MAG: hypothetical protein U0U67_05745 [Chitinophagales bacterium]